MDFSLTDEQRMLSDLVDRFVEKSYGAAERRSAIANPEGFSRAHWHTLAQTGLLGLNVSEELGGMAGSPVDTLVVMQGFGHGLLVEPFVHNAVVAARLLGANASANERLSGHLRALAAGDRLFGTACLEPGGRFDLDHVNTQAKPDGDGWLLSGHKCAVPFGDSADVLLVSARTDGQASGDAGGISLFAVDHRACGVQVQGFAGFDGHRLSEVHLNGVRVDRGSLVGPLGGGLPLLQYALDHGIAALCAEAVGALQALLDLTAGYLRERKQFGKPIASFQALQHRAAEMAVAVDQARSAAYMAAANVENPDPVARRRALSAAKALVGRSGAFVGEAATQLHGGMGMTDEMSCGHYFKRLVGIDKTWGDSEHHTGLFASVMA